MKFDLSKFEAMSKADLVSFITLLLSALNTIESGARFDYKIGDVVIAGKSLDYGVYVEQSATPAARPGSYAEELKVTEKPIDSSRLWK